MFRRRLLIVLSVTLVSLLGVSCGTPETSSGTGAIAPSSAPAAPTSQVQSSKGGVVDVTPMSEAELAAQPKGQSGPGAASGDSQAQPPSQSGQPEKTVLYADNTNKFSVAYPPDFAVRAQPAEKLAQLKPAPAASSIFMNPVAASSDTAELEPADLEIRVYVAEPGTSLESWLTSNDLLTDGGSPLKPFKAANASGVQVCASTMIAPGCSYFVLGNGRVYQLTPASLAGEAMASTFMLLP